jgi:hypothetical protein
MEKQSLVSLTQAFLKILTDADGGEVDLSIAEKTLKTTKRRLYDVINVLAGVNVVQRTGKSRVRLISSCPPEVRVSADTRDYVEREREIDALLAVVDSELADLSESELFKRCAWVDADDADACAPDRAISLFALRGPPSMSIVVRDDETDINNRTVICKVEDPRDGCIQIDPIRSDA